MAKDKELARLKRQHTVRLSKLIGRAYYLNQRRRKSEMYNLVCNEFVSLGGVYIKFLQGVLLNSPIMREWRTPDKLKIFENLDTEPIDIVKILQRELPSEKLQNIALVQPEPFAAGSFGQVYLGQHKSGKTIIIKALRPQMRALLKHDLRLLGMFSRHFVKSNYENMDIKLDDAIREFRQATLRETDYISEAAFAREMFEAYKTHPRIVVPETYLELCTPDLIVQDYVDGISGVELLRLKNEGKDPKEYVAEQLGSDLDVQLTALGVESLVGAFTLPRVQGDPHPGNVRFLPNNQIALIDFGIYAHAPRNKPAFFGVIDEWNRVLHESKDVVNLFEQFIRFFVTDLYRALKKISTLRAPSLSAKNNNLVKEVGRVVQGIVDGAIGTQDLRTIIDDGSTMKFFNNLVNKGNRLGLVVRFESSEILRAAQTYVTLVESLGRRKEVLENVFDEVVRRVEQEYPGIRHGEDDPVSIGEAIEIINNWLERVAVRDPALFRQIISRIRNENASINQSVQEKASA